MTHAHRIEARLVELENRHMHQERLVEELNGVIVEQRALIDRLGQKVAQMEARLESGAAEDGGHDEKPPHY